MSGMNGVELADSVRARRPSFPVVFFTGGDVEPMGGERWVLTKPFLMRALVETVREALGQAQETDPARHSTTTRAR
jgi:FixJ family two-component response regulator